MKKWMAIIAALALAVAATTAIVVAGGGDGEAKPAADSQVEEPAGEQAPVRSDEGSDPDECSRVDACDEGERGLPTNGGEPVRSDERIDPGECNLVHNINACTEEELEQGFPNTP